MKKKLLMMLALLGTSILTSLASTISASACVWGVYQPQEPKLLRQRKDEE